jgi:HEAT repeat protein
VATRDDLTDIAGSIWPVDGALARNLCRVAGSLGSSRFAPNLVVMLGSTDTSVRLAAAQALGQLEGEQEGISALSFALADEEPEVRAAACRALGHLAAAAFLQSLLSATCDPSPLVRAAAVASLVGQSDSAVLARYRAIIVADAVPTVVVQAIAGVGASGLDRDLTMLMSLGRSEDHEVVKASARALRNFAAHRATAALLGLLGHERWDVRWAAAEVLGERRDPTALEALRSALPDEEDRLVQQVLTDAIAGLEHAG